MTKRLRVTIVQHSYIADENQKNLDYLGEKLELQVIVPKWRQREGERVYGDTSVARPMIKWQHPVYVPGTGQMVLRPFGWLLAQHDPDIIVVAGDSWSPLTIETILLARLFAPRARIVCNVVKNTYQRKGLPKDAVKRLFRRFADRRIAAYVAGSKVTKELYQRKLEVAPEKIHVCYLLGVDLDLFCPRIPPSAGSSSRAIIGYCGRFHPRKGVQELVEAAKRVRADHDSPVQLRLLGDGPLRPWLETEAEHSNWLSVEGPVAHDGVAPFLQGCDIFAFPSRIQLDHEEHDAHALVEAMAVGLPAVTTSSGIIPEVITRESALTVGENSPGELACALAELVTSPSAREQMGICARLLAQQRFGLAAVANRHVEIYQEIARLTPKDDVCI